MLKYSVMDAQATGGIQDIFYSFTRNGLALPNSQCLTCQKGPVHWLCVLMLLVQRGRAGRIELMEHLTSFTSETN